MAVTEHEIKEFSDWYQNYQLDDRDGSLRSFIVGTSGSKLWSRFSDYKREMDMRVSEFPKLEMLADGEVISKKTDLPNVSSGETAGIVRRIARNLVQHTPNVEIVSKFDDDSLEGAFTRHILTAKVIGDDQYSNDMQQNLFASVKNSFTLGFDAVIPVLLQDNGGSWFIKYDTIHYRDVYPEPGAKDVRQATDAFVRRYLTKGEVLNIIRQNTLGWDIAALKTLVKTDPPVRAKESASHADTKVRTNPKGYEIITWYSDSGAAFLTFSASTKMLLRIEKNKHPLKWHPVHFLVLEKDSQQPLGKSQVELLLGRQEFQDLMLNGAMKLWYRNINPSIIGYGIVNSIPNLSPGKYTQISNPNAKVEAFEVNTQTLLQYGQISAQNLGSMVTLVGAADQQMAQSSGGSSTGMSATPQGVTAQQQMVDITTNNYQKAIESFFSHYCSYALTLYFHELKGTKKVEPTADARKKMLNGGIKPEAFSKDGSIDIDFSGLATEYWVRCIPGSLVELEDEKQLRILNELFVPLSQAMPAIANSGDQEALKFAVQALQYIIQQEIQLSGAASSTTISEIFTNGKTADVEATEAKTKVLDSGMTDLLEQYDVENTSTAMAVADLQSTMSVVVQTLGEIAKQLGMTTGSSEEQPNTSQQPIEGSPAESGNV